MTMSTRRPSIHKKRKLPFQQNDQPTPDSYGQSGASTSKEPPRSTANQSFRGHIRFMSDPSMSATQGVIPKTVDLQSDTGAFTAKGKQYGAHGPNTFIIQSESSSCRCGSCCQPVAEVLDLSMRSTAGQPGQDETTNNSLDVKPVTAMESLNEEVADGALDTSLSDIEWLGKMTTSFFESGPPTPTANKANHNSNSNILQAHNAKIDTQGVLKQPVSVRPPYSYKSMIQFAINSTRNRSMTLKEIYTWIEDHFPYFRDVTKKTWKSSVRHNLWLHDMFIHQVSPDGKVSFWTIRPQANRFLTLDPVSKPDCDPTTAHNSQDHQSFTASVSHSVLGINSTTGGFQQQSSMLPKSKETPTGSVRRMKPFLPHISSYLVPIQFPVASLVLMPPSSPSQCTPSCSQQKRYISQESADRF